MTDQVMIGATERAHRIRVRYADCDMQGVVFNANYFTYLDDAIDTWFHDVLGENVYERFDYAVKKATMEWSSPARVREVVEVAPQVTRWGRTSFDVTATFTVGDRLVGRADVVLVSIRPGTYQPAPIPGDVRAALTRD